MTEIKKKGEEECWGIHSDVKEFERHKKRQNKKKSGEKFLTICREANKHLL